MSEEIKPINSETVHRICSGQVVLSLSIAVKELVENSIDAGAKNIEIRLKNYGLDALEVVDNGTGVQEKNFAALTLKHYTSKIREFHDLESVATLGFRGEALSSLCALADLTIITRHESTEHGTKLQYDHNGHIKTQSLIARSIGTSIQLSNLFSTLPVRRKEFTKNHKTEFNKMCSLLHAYCLVCTNVKFTCSNQVSNSKNIILSTLGQGSVTDNIINIFGAKQSPNLFQVALVQPDETIAGDYGVKFRKFELSDTYTSPFQFDFYISSVMHGCGRSSSDRQFYYINSRPCEPHKIAKLVNDTYKMYNSHQFPFVYLNIIVGNSSLVDVNVTPDKRQIFLEQEKLLLATVRMSLIESFKNFPSTYKMQNLDISQQQNKRKLDEAEGKGNFITFLDNFKKKSKLSSANDDDTAMPTEEHVIACPCPVMPKRELKQKPLFDFDIEKKIAAAKIDYSSSETSDSEESQQRSGSTIVDYCEDNSPSQSSSVLPKTQSTSKLTIFDSPLISSANTIDMHHHFNSLDFSLSFIKEAVKQRETDRLKNKELIVKFRCEITPQTNKDAVKELQKQFTKDMFKRMSIIGQFNYAFIVASLDQDLFIIDQHASDEKYNFEMLQRNTIMDSQILVNPKSLQLTSVDENILLEHEHTFNKNGFYFEHDPNVPQCPGEGRPTDRTKLIKIPLSKSTIFGVDDIDEMIYMLKEGADSNCRPSRICGMFAMRACRKSVMVGKALNRSAMKRLVDHMGDIEQPWNCPHGRPTMRHLINLNLIN